jgi:hypothetical protein
MEERGTKIQLLFDLRQAAIAGFGIFNNDDTKVMERDKWTFVVKPKHKGRMDAVMDTLRNYDCVFGASNYSNAIHISLK